MIYISSWKEIIRQFR